MKLELANKANDAKGFDVNNEDFSQLKSRILGIEQKLEEMFMEEDALQDDEDYDSQEEMDNMMEDIDLVAKREESAEDETEDNQSTIPEIPQESLQFKSETTLNSEVTTLDPMVSTPDLEKKIDSQPKLEIDKPMSRNSRNRGSSIGGESKNMQRRGSKESSIAGRTIGGGGALKGINRKITAMQKEIDTNKENIEEHKNYVLRLEGDIAKNLSYIESVEKKLGDMFKQLDVMEASFIRGLRRNGLDKKKTVKEVVVNVPHKGIENIEKNIEEKLKRIITVESDVEKIFTDVNHLKKNYREKINEIILSLKDFEEFKHKSHKDFEKISNLVMANQENCKKNFSVFSSKFSDISEPLTDLISDQQRENQSLNEDLKRPQELFRALVEEYSNSRINNRTQTEQEGFVNYAQKFTDNYFRKNRNISATPDVSVKTKFYKTNYSIRNSPTKMDSK